MNQHNYLSENADERLLTYWFYTVIENLREGILVEDSQHNILQINKQFCKIFQFAEGTEQMVGIDYVRAAERSSVCVKDPDAFVSQINVLRQLGKPVSGELIEFSNGKIFERDFTPIYRDGKYNGCIWQYGEVTEKQKTEKFLQDLLTHTTDLVFTHDFYARIIRVNPAFCNALGVSEDKILNRNLSDFIHPEFMRDFNGYLNSINKDRAFNGLFRMINAQGKIMYWKCSVHRIGIDEGHESIIVFADDITDLISSQRELVKTHLDLEASQKIKEQFFANMSHEIRTPLNGIIGLTKLLQETGLSHEQSKYLNLIEQSSQHLQVIINDILDISKIRMGRLRFENIPFNVSDTIHQPFNSLQVLAQEKGLIILSSLDDCQGLYAIGDPYRLNQVIVNLLSNAIKFTSSPGSVTFTASFQPIDNNRIKLQCAVKDTGIGISKVKIQHIFDEFSQADSSISRQFGGTGLGLAICKNIIEKQGGKIGVESELEKGSTFWFELPLLQCSASEFENFSKQHARQLYKFQYEKVLLAEDNEVNALLATTILKQWGLTVDLAVNGVVAVTRAMEKKYQLIIMDIHMPEMDGMEAAKLIKKRGLNTDTPIIALTANAMPDQIDYYLRQGMQEVVSKPFVLEDLNRAILHFIKGKPVALKEPAMVKAKEEKGKPIRVGVPVYEFFDLDKFNEQTGKLREIQEQTSKAFIEYTPPLLADIKDALAQADKVRIQQYVHKLKASTSLLCVEPLRQELVSLEKEASRVGQEEYDSRVHQLLANVAMLVEEVKLFKASLP